MCWHRPGKSTKQGTVTCRNCGVAIEQCPCVGPWDRSVDHLCYGCDGSMWVAIVRSKLAKTLEAFANFD